MKPCSKNIHKTVTHDTESLHTRWEKHIHASSIVNSHAKQNRPLFNVYLTLRTNYLKTHVIVTEINTGEDWLLSLTIGSTGHISAMYEGLAYLTGCVRVWCRCTVAKHLNGWSWFLLCASPQQTATLLLHLSTKGVVDICLLLRHGQPPPSAANLMLNFMNCLGKMPHLTAILN